MDLKQKYKELKEELFKNPSLINDKQFNYDLNECINALEEKFTVWVGGVEVNDYLLTREEAENLAFEYEEDGYDDIIIEKIKN